MMVAMSSFRTLQARPTPGTMIKPGELIDVVEMTPLTLHDRRTYNLLLHAAWDQIDKPVEHKVSLAELRGTHNANDRVADSVRRLMAAVVEVRIEREGKAATQRVQLLGANVQHDDEAGFLYYRFPDELRTILTESRIFARLQREVMFALTSKYALALYEMVQKRGNLDRQWSEIFEVDQLRNLLGVEPDKLQPYKNFRAWALAPALEEVNALSDYGVAIDETRKGRKVTAIKLSWWRKSETEIKAAFKELQRHSSGRKARIRGTATSTVAPQT